MRTLRLENLPKSRVKSSTQARQADTILHSINQSKMQFLQCDPPSSILTGEMNMVCLFQFTDESTCSLLK